MTQDEGLSTDEPVESGALEDEDGAADSDDALQDEQQGKGYGAG